jgi:phosphopantothenoylcysteine decarboxylase / phosphopantothenate---cysteine ligase
VTASASPNGALAGRRVLLGVCGGVAAYKSVTLARALSAAGAEVTVVMTASATRFVGPDTFSSLTGRPAHTSLWERPGEVLHVRLAQEHDLAVIAPATANLMAKLACGLADDLLTCTLLEFRGPVVVAPAMHTGMWEHPATRHNVEVARARGVVFVGPVSGALAHGDEGTGRLAEPDVIAEAAARSIASTPAADLVDRVVVVTAGPTYEPLDAVRFLGNRSTGAMGVALAAEAARRGADVRLVLGPGTVDPPGGVSVVRVHTTEEMRAAVRAELGGADAVIMAAAVADFRPVTVTSGKLKKHDGPPSIVLEPTPDILQELAGLRRPEQYLVGFAAETHDVEASGRAKLATKGPDLIVANEVGRPGTGFGSTTNRAAIIDASGRDVGIRDWTKAELAEAIVDRVAAAVADGPHRPVS